MERVIYTIDRISIWVGKLFSWTILLLTGVVIYEVFMRYALRSPTSWAYDVSYMLYGGLFIMTGAYALARNAHVRGDVISRLWPVKAQATIELLLYFLFFFPGIIALIYSGLGFAKLSWMMNEHSSFSPDGPPLYHFKTLIPLAGFFLLLQGIAECLRCLYVFKHGHWPARVQDVEETEREIIDHMQQGSQEPTR